MTTCADFPPCARPGCGHAACSPELYIHSQAAPHPCNTRGCSCAGYVEPEGFEGGGGGYGGGGATGGWGP